MKAPSTGQRILIVVLATLMLALSATMAWAAASDFASRGTVPQGVSVNGTDLSNMTEAQARQAITDAVSQPLERPVTVTAGEQTFTFDPKGAVTVDVDTMLDEAYAPRDDAAYLDRIVHAVRQQPYTFEVAPKFAVDEEALGAFIAQVASEVDTKPVNAKVKAKGHTISVTPAKEGLKTDVDGAATALANAFTVERAMSQGDRAVVVPVSSTAPKVTDAKIAKTKTITVDLSERKIRLWKGDKIEKTYPCAVGTASFPTPQGKWKITQKRFRPTWVNPGSDWAKDMPPSIPPGPGNPLGTRAINLSAPGIRFHGTENIGSVGTAASHGCMRMYRSDIEDLFERVKVGMTVYIVP